MNVFIFGDQTADQFTLLQKVVSRKDNTLLTSFLERVSVALREEVQLLPRSQRDAIPDFLTINHLVEAYHDKGVKVAQLESCFLTIAQLAHFIGYYCENPTELPNSQNCRLIGLCTGLLAASAVACARSVSDLLPLAVEAVRIAFRTGTVVGNAKLALEANGNAKESWSTIVTNTNEETANAALDDFHAANGIPPPNQAYVSAVSVMALTISGPPSTTRRFFAESDVLSKNHRVPIPVYAPYHAAHLYSDEDVDKIVDSDTQKNLRFFRPGALVHSASTGKCHRATTAAELFQLVISEILEAPVRWDHLLEETVSQITSASASECHVTAVGITNVTNSLVSALKAGGQTNVTVKDYTSWGIPSESFGRTQSDKIAIVGMAGRFPSAANHDALWELLAKGMDVHREIPADRFDAKAHCDPSGKGKNKSHTPFGCFIDEPGLFDPRFFNMSPREAAQTDPMGRLALVTAYEALEMSGYVPNRTPSTKLHRIGTFYGQTSDDWREINAAENVDTYFITGGVRAFAPGRINYYFKFSGPSYSIDTACSSSLAAIQLACTSLWAGDCDTACAGGLNVLTNPDIFAGLSKGQFLSKTGSCKTYDNGADGYCRGDGCGTVVLKRYEDAIADKDNILGCILAAATNHSAEAVSITHPHAGAQEFLYKRTLATAGIDAHDISYVEMHGTGTQAGDGIEMTSVTNAFAPRDRQRRPDQPLYLGAVKANIGHGEAASGINSLIKVLMMMRKSAIPANVGIKGIINQTFPKDLGQRNVHIPVEHTPFPRRGAEPRKLFLNNFSAAGGNTSLLITDGPLNEGPKMVDPRSSHLVTVSARSIASLKRNLDLLSGYLSANPGATLPSLSYTTTARRIQHNYRVAFTVPDMSKVRDALQAQVKDTYSPIAMVPTKAAFCFTGQGSQYTSLGKKLYEDLPTFRADIDELNKLTLMQGLPSFLQLLDGTDVATLSPVVVQLGMACIQVALSRMWSSWNVKPTVVIGHSLGEYAALHVAGVLSASDMILLVGRRAQLLEQDCTKYTHGMLAVKANVETMEEVLGDKMTEVACVNGPEETVLCGTTEVVAAISEIVAGKGFKSTKLNVPFAFHSAQVDPILESFKEAAAGVTFNKPTIPVLSPLTGDIIREAGIIGPDYLARHARETVNFWAALSQGQDEKIFDEKTAWVEVGAHPVCSGMVRASLGGAPVTAPSLRRNEDPWKTLTNSLATLYLAGVAIDFNEFHREFNDAQQLLELPTYSFDSKKYWLDYHNNWTLTKGEARVEAAPKAIEPVVEMKSKLSTTSCQRIIKEDLQANTGRIVIQSNMTEPKLYAAVTGHQVNGAPLCPSSLYADMAMTAANYLYEQLRPGAGSVGLNVCDMEVHKPLVAIMPPPPEGQHLQLEAAADLEEGLVHLNFRHVKADGSVITELGHGLVKYEDTDAWTSEWKRTEFMVQAQVDRLHEKLQAGSAHKILRGMAYKLFKALVTYSPQYRGMEEVILDGKTTEATAKVRFPTTDKDGDFFCSPYWIDGLAHISGFIVNASDVIDSSESVYISHGWKSIRISRPLSADKEYRSYVRMQPVPGNISEGDVYIFEGSEIIGVVNGLKFQNIPRRALNIMVPPMKNGATVAGNKSAPSAPKFVAPAPKAITAAPASRSKTVKPVKTVKVAPPKPVKAKKAPKATGGNSMVSRVMKIIAEETDVDMSELVDEAAFENLGVDSLMSLTISAKFREDLDLDISSTLFTDHPSVGEMKKFFSQYDNGAPVEEDDSDVSEDDSDLQTPYDEEVSTPASSAPSSAPSIAGDSKPVAAKPSAAAASGSGPSLARTIIAQEMGVTVEEITDKADLSELGMDSLMSLTILGALREATGIDIASTFLVTNPCIEDIENALGMRAQPAEVADSKPKAARPVKPSAKKPKAQSTEMDQVSQKLAAIQRDISNLPPANSVLLQGNAKTATKKFFLLPDGSGSATSYVSIPNLSPDMAVYGLNCPFMKKPENFTCGIENVTGLYLAEIKRRQPVGPYIIGGWSAGGVIAYETAMQLIQNGETVERLLLLDSPCPVALDPLPARLHIFFDQIGLLGTGKAGGTPGWLLPHFSASIAMLSAYEPVPFPKGKAPRTVAIWCRDGVCKNADDPRPPPAEDEDPAPMKWLLNNRTDFSHNGWGQLVDENNMEFYIMDGNHFSMMKEPYVSLQSQTTFLLIFTNVLSQAQELGKHIRAGLGFAQ
ncbi:ketoacyl-synt-domain-containing protein [Tothia fuscella]|uniref:Ketoacyl-synt-domain-containing protein n=1 Tax=Tothia fuscella TaxID=1048955 RepID=A0A9P4NPY1_9PEZI|nr:ketoacyl-synt-domain-containing protein [Tothia fuscella]